MNRSYLIVPAILLALFGFVYWQHSQEADAREARREAVIAKQKADEQAKKDAADRKAKEDADRRAEEHRKEEEAKDKARKEKYDAETQKIKTETAKYNADTDAATKKAAALEQELASLRAKKEKTNHEAFELTKQVELAQIDKRNAELEVQRMTDMIAKKAADSSMAKPPMVAAAPKQ